MAPAVLVGFVQNWLAIVKPSDRQATAAGAGPDARDL